MGREFFLYFLICTYLLVALLINFYIVNLISHRRKFHWTSTEYIFEDFLLLSYMKSDIRIVLEPAFQKRLFSDLIAKYSSLELSKRLYISRPMIYHYRNGRVKNISHLMLERICDLLQIDKQSIQRYIVQTYSFKESVQKIMDVGKECRKNNLRELQQNYPHISDVVRGGVLNVELWFSHHERLLRQMRHDLSVEKINNKILIEFSDCANGEKKQCKRTLPKKIELDEDFLYFFGLWLGDNVGRPRFGIVNKEKTINEETAKILRKYGQDVHSHLYIGEHMPTPNVDVEKVYKIKNGTNGWAIQVFSSNGIFNTFFEYLENHLDEVLRSVDTNIVFAGLFDAEGNVFLEDSCVRWSCKDEEQLRIYKKHLTEMKLHDRYDGHGNMVSYNLYGFEKRILPYLRHPQKVNACNLLLNRRGELPMRFIEILNTVEREPGLLQKEVAQRLKRVKVSAQLRFLEKLGTVTLKGYPKRAFPIPHALEKLRGRN